MMQPVFRCAENRIRTGNRLPVLSVMKGIKELHKQMERSIRMNTKKLKLTAVLCLVIVCLVSVLSAYAGVSDHTNVAKVNTTPGEWKPIPSGDPVYGARYSMHCRDDLVTFTCSCHGGRLITETERVYQDHQGAGFVYVPHLGIDRGGCTTCGAEVRRPHLHFFRQVSFTIVTPYLTVYTDKCACGQTRTRAVHK